jgi:membrane-associated phospholipid phosphatase
MRRRLVFLSVFALAGPLGAADPSTSSLFKKTLNDGGYLVASPARLQKNDIPTAFGVVAVIGGAMAFDRTGRSYFSDYTDTQAAKDLKKYGDIAQFIGPIAGIGFGIKGWSQENDRDKQITWDLLESLAWSSALSLVSRVVLGRTRPDKTDDPFHFKAGDWAGSFPSGHTTAAFSAAATIGAYYPDWRVQVPVYTAATAVGFSRLYANRHWTSDVVSGALLGYGVAHALHKRHKEEGGWYVNAGPGGIQLTRKF